MGNVIRFGLVGHGGVRCGNDTFGKTLDSSVVPGPSGDKVGVSSLVVVSLRECGLDKVGGRTTDPYGLSRFETQNCIPS